MPEVSVIIAIYNVEEYLPRCLDSVLDQTFQDIEIIVVNDGSLDNCLPIIHNYKLKDPRIVVINKQNGGLSDARNAGIAVAKGRFITFLDGDDTYDIDFILKMYTKMQEKAYDLVCSNYAYVWAGQDRIVHKNFLNNLPSTLDKKQAISAFLRQEIIGSVAIKMFRKSIFDKFSLRFPKGQNWEDIPFTFEYLIHVDSVCVLKESLYYYLQSDSSITRQKESLNILDIMKASKCCVKLNEEEYPGEFYQENRALLTRSFICLLVYAFKCKDPKIYQCLREELQIESKNTSLSLLTLKEKLLIVLFRANFSLSKWIFFKIYKRNQNS